MKKLFGLNFYDKDLLKLIEELKIKINNDGKVSVFTPNVDHIINNKEDSKIEQIYTQSDYIIADGWPIVAVSKLKKIPIKRITGVDLMDELLKIANEYKYNIFFLGANDDVLEKININIKKEYSSINIVNFNNGYFSDDKTIIKKINKNKNHILFVGMGNPKQEIWIRENLNSLNVNIAIGVGGAFNIYSKDVSRAPKFIQKIGMEWFYRFLKEPKRLFRRYFIKYPKFIKSFFKEIKTEEMIM